MFCPRGHGEFVAGVTVCPDCDVALRERPPASAGRAARSRPALAPLHWQWRRGGGGLAGGLTFMVPLWIVVATVAVVRPLFAAGGAGNVVFGVVLAGVGVLVLAMWFRWLRRPVSRASQRRAEAYVESGEWGTSRRRRNAAARDYFDELWPRRPRDR